MLDEASKLWGRRRVGIEGEGGCGSLVGLGQRGTVSGGIGVVGPGNEPGHGWKWDRRSMVVGGGLGNTVTGECGGGTTHTTLNP